MKKSALALAFLVGWMIAVPVSMAQKTDDAEHAELAKALRDTKIDSAASEAASENKGYRVVSVMPALKDGHPVADVTLVKGTEWKSVSEKLD